MSLVERLHEERKERLARLGVAPVRGNNKLNKILAKQSDIIDEIKRDAPDIVAEWVKRQKSIADDLQEAVHDAGYIRPSVAAIQAAVAKYFNVGVTDLLSGRRHKDIILPRHIGFYLCRKLTLQSLPDIGRRFGGRDHTTVMHAVHKVTGLLEKDPSIAAAIDAIKQELRVAA
jgi:chromosomal replication initiation ATPase DnaA